MYRNAGLTAVFTVNSRAVVVLMAKPRSRVKVELAVLDPSLIILMVSVDVKQRRT